MVRIKKSLGNPGIASPGLEITPNKALSSHKYERIESYAELSDKIWFEGTQ